MWNRRNYVSTWALTWTLTWALTLLPTLPLTLLPLGCVPTEDARLEVTDELREACAPLTDADIRAMLVVCDTDRRDGMTKSEALSAVFDSCYTSLSCVSCGTLAVEQVYSK